MKRRDEPDIDDTDPVDPSNRVRDEGGGMYSEPPNFQDPEKGDDFNRFGRRNRILRNSVRSLTQNKP